MSRIESVPVYVGSLQMLKRPIHRVLEDQRTHVGHVAGCCQLKPTGAAAFNEHPVAARIH